MWPKRAVLGDEVTVIKHPAAKARAGRAGAGTKRPRADWDAIEPHYRAGIRSLADIGSEFGVSDAAIIKHARKQEWTRNLAGKIQAKADAKVSAALVSAEVSAQTKITENLTVEVEARVQARVRLSQRKDIGRGRSLSMKMLDELESQTGEQPLIEELRNALAEDESAEGKRRLNDAWQRVMSLPARVDTLKKWSDAARILFDKEREAYGIETGNKGADGTGLPVVSVKDLTGRKFQAAA